MYRPAALPPGEATRCAGPFEAAASHARAVYDALKRRPDIKPDLIVAHSGFATVRREAEIAAFKRSTEPEWREAFRGAEHLQIRYIPDANHCIMFDQPEAFSRLLLDELHGMNRQRTSDPR